MGKGWIREVPSLALLLMMILLPRASLANYTEPVPRPDDPGVKKIKRELLTDQWFKDNQASLTCRDGLAYKGGKLYLPEALRLNALKHSHDVKRAGHFGYLKTLHLTRRQFWWPGLKKDVENYVKSCTVCATMKRIPGKTPGLLQPVADPSQPWKEIAMDFIVDLPESSGNTVNWTDLLPFVEVAYNDSVHSSTGYTPFKVATGTEK